MENNRGLVYSSAFGKMCFECGKPVKKCICKARLPFLESDGVVRIRHETKGRKGKGVSVITGLLLPLDELKQLGKMLKTQCGTGGTVKADVIEIQGDHVDKLAELLQRKGWTVRTTEK